MVIVFPPRVLSAASSDARLFCLLEYKYFWLISFSFIYKIFFLSEETAKNRTVKRESVTDVIVII